MRLIRPVLPLAVAIVLLPVPAAADDRGADVDTFVTQRMAATGVPGASLSIIDGGEVVHTRRFGRTGDGDTVTTDTPFMWGSIAKPMTAVAVLRLAENGKLELDAEADRYLDGFRPHWNGAATTPTIAQLLSHTSGLPGIESADVTDHGGRTDAVSEVAAELDDIELVAEPGTDHHYSSLNYLVLGAVVEQVTGRPFREALTERVFEPLGMDDVVADAATARRRLPSGNRLWFGRPIAHRVGFDESGLPYGYLGGTTADLTAFARAALTRDDRLLSEESWRAAQSAQTPDGSYGFGWSIRESHGEPLVFHTGTVPGYHANLLLLPERDLAVVLTQNAYGEAWALPLRATSEGAARVWLGDEPDPMPEPDSLLATAPWVVSSIALLLLLVAVVSAIRPVRGRPAVRLRVAAWLATAVAVPALMLWLTPMLVGVSLRILWLFLPDLAAALVAVSAAAIVLAAVRCVKLARARKLAR